MPVLIAEDDFRKADGECTFYPREDEIVAVRVVTRADAKNWVRTELKSAFDHSLFVGVGTLKRAYDENDEFAMQRGYEMLQTHAGVPSPETKRKDFGRGVSLLTGGQRLGSIPYAYSQLTTELLKSAHFVMWYMEGRFLPSLYCPDKKTAVFAMQFMGRILVCPECDTPFIPAAGNMDYCCVAHRESYRVKRFRWRAKQRANEVDNPTGRAAKTRSKTRRHL